MKTELVLTPLQDGRSFIVDEDFTTTIKCDSYEGEFTVPAQTKTDLASIPRVLWSWLPPFGKYTSSSVIHDYLYSRGGKIDELSSISRKDCDQVFYNEMIENGVNRVKAKTMYSAVRCFGGKFFKK